MRPCCLILSCSKDSYTKARMNNWASISQLAEKMPIFYVFGKSDRTQIPSHPNVFVIKANCNDNYEDIPFKIYYGLRFLGLFDFDYIIKLDETINILNVPMFYSIVSEEMKIVDYLSLTGIGGCRGFPEGSIVFSYWHSSKTSNPILANMPAIVMRNIEYAGGPGYVLSRRSYKSLVKNDFTHLYEDYSIGLALSKHGIAVGKSHIVDQKILYEEEKNVQSPCLEIQMSPSLLDTLKMRPIKPVNKCIINVGGGLGNQLFQIVAAMSYCYENDMELLIKPGPNPRPYYWDSILSPFKSRLTDESFDKYEAEFSYKKIPSFDKNIELSGYFQSSKYFSALGPVLKNMLCFPDIQEKYEDILTKDHVIIHVRRGDYLTKKQVHTNLEADLDRYYKKAMEYFSKKIANPKFIVVSDDPEWKEIDGTYIHESDITTLWLMMKSSNLIIANSTFSWWGAYLSGGEVVAPKEWFGPEGPSSKDIYEPSWILL